MQPITSKKFTYQTRFRISESQDELLSETAFLLSKVERALFKDLYQKKRAINELKAAYLKQYGITARQFNSCRIKLEGKVLSYKALQSDRRSALEQKIKKQEKHIKRLKNPLKIHHKKRRLSSLKTQYKKLLKDKEEGKIRICFGSRKLFHQQFHLEENGFATKDQWKKTWVQTRSSSFFLVGSKDETCGNQSCRLVKNEGGLTLFMRLPNTFSQKSLKIENLSFGYGQAEIEKALESNELRRQLRLLKKPYKHLGTAVNCLFKKDQKGWRIFVTIDEKQPLRKSQNNCGVIGLDINIDRIALAETDRFGNLIYKKSFPFSTHGKSSNQSKAVIGDIVKQITEVACLKHKPLVIEKLNFEKKKQSLREENNSYSRMLSSFCYRQLIASIESRAFREGIEVCEVNPAFTSIIGRTKFMARYGLSTHISAALVIGRRLDNYSEKLPRYLEITDNKNSRSAFFQPARNRKKHVWSSYGELTKKLKTANVLHVSTIIRSSRKLKLLCDSCDFDILPGKLRYVNSLTELLG
jgi:IS605 OrfB family transposase